MLLLDRSRTLIPYVDLSLECHIRFILPVIVFLPLLAQVNDELLRLLVRHPHLELLARLLQVVRDLEDMPVLLVAAVSEEGVEVVDHAPRHEREASLFLAVVQGEVVELGTLNDVVRTELCITLEVDKLDDEGRWVLGYLR